MDLNQKLVFPPKVVFTDMRPDLVVWFKKGRVVVIGELINQKTLFWFPINWNHAILFHYMQFISDKNVSVIPGQ